MLRCSWRNKSIIIGVILTRIPPRFQFTTGAGSRHCDKSICHPSRDTITAKSQTVAPNSGTAPNRHISCASAAVG